MSGVLGLRPGVGYVIERLYVVTGKLRVEHLATIASACKYLRCPYEESRNELGDELLSVDAFVKTARVLLVQRQSDSNSQAPIDFHYYLSSSAPENDDREVQQECEERHVADKEWGLEIRRVAKVAI
jgi:hypothetical protein